MGELGQWLRTLVGLVLIIALLDMLLLENDMKKIAKLVMGLVIMLGILQPILALVNSNWEIWYYPIEFQGQTYNIDWNERSESLRQAGITPVMRHATDSLENQVEIFLVTNHLIDDAQITTLINNQGELQQVQIIIFPSGSLEPELITQVKHEAITSVARYLQISETLISVEFR